MRLRLCAAVFALCLLFPGANAAATPAPTRSHRGLVLPGRRAFSWTPSSTEAYAACGRPSARHPECGAIIVPNIAAGVSAGSAGRPAPALVVDTSEKQISEHGPKGPFTPAGLREAYDLPSESAGAGQTVGIVDAFNDPDAESDLSKYRSHFGLGACTSASGCFRKVNQSGGTTYPVSASAIWAVEISLDVDMVSAACPKCHILLVEATNAEYANLTAAENEAVTLGATELNDSWGSPEFSGQSTFDKYFNHPGVPITVAAGDTGGVATYPAVTPDVISVGATALERAKNARGFSETVWGGEGTAGTGSGCSVYEPKPAWQTDAGCAKRTDNDVAVVGATSTPVWVADSFESGAYETYPGEDPGWLLSGGTSAGSALMSAIMALSNEYTRSLPGAEALYREAAQNGSGVLEDVVSGHDGACASYLCEALPGYDGPTGLGSPYGAPEALASFQQEPQKQEPQGSWLGKVGSAGYLLAGWGPPVGSHGAQDVSDLPNVTADLVQGSRWQWAQNTTDVRALQGLDGAARDAATYYDPNQIQMRLTFSTAYTGNLHLYAVDWDSTARRETVSVNLRTQALSSSFNQGAWLTFPVKVAAGETLTVTVTRTAGTNAVLSGIFLGEAGAPPAPTASSAPQGAWVGKVGSEGYDLAGWDGPTGDVSYLPDAELSLWQGSRYQWARNTTDARALSDPAGLTKNAGTYYDANQLMLALTFKAAYKGTLHLYAVDFDHAGRREVVTANGHSPLSGESSAGPWTSEAEAGQSAVLQEFGEGAWLSFPVNVAAGGYVTIAVQRTAGANAVLSGVFLGENGAPAALTASSAPQGSWVGKAGSEGYDLADWDGPAGDVSYLPHASLSLVAGGRYQWAAQSSDARALSDPSGLTRNAGTYYDPNQIRLTLSATASYTGNLHLYAVDWDHGGRREIVTVNGQSAVLGEFSEGAWVSFPISVLKGETVTITVDRTAGANAVLSGIFMGDAGPPPAMETPSAPQGNWVGSYGSAGYDLGGWNGESDFASMPGVSVSLAQGNRYVWAPSTTDPRALERPDGLTREAATYYDPNQIRLSLTFNSAYTGNLHLYAVDWDSTERRERISVNGQTAVLSGSFNQGAWVSLPISVAAGESVSIVVDHTAGANAVLSGVFLGTGLAAQKALIPLYDNANAADWTQACSQTAGGSLIIADVAEGQGPGSASVPAWANVIGNCPSYGRASVIGYVWTDYGEGGEASIAGIESEINAWYSYYPGEIAGIFFDGVSDAVPGTSTSNEGFYQALASYVHTHEGSGAQVVFNFGANPGSDWMLKSHEANNNANVIVTFEGSYDTAGEDPYTAWTQAAWEEAYPADDFAALVYNAPSEAATPQPASSCNSLAKQNVGYAYVGTWYDVLAPYFPSFLTDSASGEC